MRWLDVAMAARAAKRARVDPPSFTALSYNIVSGKVLLHCVSEW